MKKQLPIKDICLDAGTQQRAVDDDVMKRYSALMKDGVVFSPVFIVTDGKNNYLWDGYHRYFATLRLGKKYIEANVENGTRRDAIFFSFSANKENAFPRQPGTAKGIVEKILKDPEWAKMSAREISNHVGVTERYVFKIQSELKSYGMNCSYHKPDSKPEKPPFRADTRNVKRGDSEYEAKVPEKKTLDATGKEVPEHLIKFFERANEYRGLVRQVHAVYKVLKDGKESGDQFYRYIDVSDLTARVNNLKHLIKFGMPYAVCGYCGGDEMNTECRACGGSGFVNEGMYKATPRELK